MRWPELGDRSPPRLPSAPRSPLHNVRKPKDGGQYPSMMLLTGDHDDRVVPLHTLKYTAELQHVLCQPGSAQRNPIVARIDTKSGHGAGKSTQKARRGAGSCARSSCHGPCHASPLTGVP